MNFFNNHHIAVTFVAAMFVILSSTGCSGIHHKQDFTIPNSGGEVEECTFVHASFLDRVKKGSPKVDPNKSPNQEGSAQGTISVGQFELVNAYEKLEETGEYECVQYYEFDYYEFDEKVGAKVLLLENARVYLNSLLVTCKRNGRKDSCTEVFMLNEEGVLVNVPEEKYNLTADRKRCSVEKKSIAIDCFQKEMSLDPRACFINGWNATTCAFSAFAVGVLAYIVLSDDDNDKSKSGNQAVNSASPGSVVCDTYKDRNGVVVATTCKPKP